MPVRLHSSNNRAAATGVTVRPQAVDCDRLLSSDANSRYLHPNDAYIEPMDESARMIFGAILMVFGVLFVWIGGAKVPVRGGAVLKLFSSPSALKPWYRWLVGAGLFFAGFVCIVQA